MSEIVAVELQPNPIDAAACHSRSGPWDDFRSYDGLLFMTGEFEILYGRGKLGFSLPESAKSQVVRKPIMPVLPDASQAIHNALRQSFYFREQEKTCLAELAQAADSACIVICDITRPVPNHLFLRPLIECLIDSGIAIGSITILVATGLHRPNLGDELEELIGDRWVLDNIRVINHDAQCDESHVDLGKTTTRSTPVRIDRWLAEADLKIATGLVEPHFMAGYSGGRKVIAPGVAHAETIRTFHNYRFMSDPFAVNCNLDKNPLHEEQLEIVKKLGGALALNTVITEDRELAFVNFGEIRDGHQEAVRFIENYCRVPVNQRFEVVITSAAGYPLDKTYYQTVKGMVGAMDILQPGGDLIIASECSEGLGSESYGEAQKQLNQLGTEAFLNVLKSKQLADVDEWQTQMQTKPMKIGRIHLYSNLANQLHSLTGVRQMTDWQGEINALTAEKSVAIIPEGPYVIPFVDEQIAQ